MFSLPIRSLSLAVGFTLLTSIAAPLGAATLEAKLYVITDWIAECPASDRPDWDNMTLGWYNSIDDFGVLYKDGLQINGNFTRSVLCDANTGTSPCDDTNRVDDADVAMIALHGSDSGNRWLGSLRRKDSSGDCKIDSRDGSGGEMALGDGDAEFLHLSSCQSMDDDNIPFVNNMFQDSTSAGTGQRLHQVDGFHGLMWISSGRDEDYANFALFAHVLPVGVAWVDKLFDWDIGDDDVDQCPVAVTVGTSLNNANVRMQESYLTINPTDPGGVNWIYYLTIQGCKPAGENVFNNPFD